MVNMNQNEELNVSFDSSSLKNEFDSVSRKIRILFWEVPLYDILMGFWERRVNTDILDMADGISEKDEIIELGSGTGQLSCLIAKKYPNSNLLCVDFSARMSELTHERLNNQFKSQSQRCSSKKKFKVLNMDCFELDESSCKYDLLVSTFLFDLQSSMQIRKLLLICERLLKDDGRILVATLDASPSDSTLPKFCKSYFNLTKQIYEKFHSSATVRKIFMSSLGYYTHCRPISINKYLSDIPSLQLLGVKYSTIRVLGIPLLWVKITEIGRR